MFRTASLAAALLAAATAAPAQDDAAPAEGAAAPQTREPEIVLSATHGDWEIRCIEGTRNCLMVQVVNNGEGEPLVRVVVEKMPSGAEAEAIMRFTTPEGVLLPRGLGLRVDGGQQVAAPFVTCAQGQCVAQASLRNQEITMFKRGAAAELTLVPFRQPDTPVTGRMSLMGFTRSFDELQ